MKKGNIHTEFSELPKKVQKEKMHSAKLTRLHHAKNESPSSLHMQKKREKMHKASKKELHEAHKHMKIHGG